MVVGMATVFIILLIVINLSKALIWVVNKYAPGEEGTKKVVKVAAALTSSADVLSAQETAVIVSAVSVATQGLCKVIKIEKK